MVYVPNPTDQVGTIDTSGTGIGPHSNVDGVTPVNDVERERLGLKERADMTLAERFIEKGKAAGTEEFQAENSGPAVQDTGEAGGGVLDQNPVPEDVEPKVPAADPANPSDSKVDPDAARQAAAERGDGGGSIAATDGGGTPESTAGADGAGADGDGDDGNQPDDGLDSMGVAALRRLAKEQDPPVEVESGANKGEIVDALRARGVKAPTS